LRGGGASRGHGFLKPVEIFDLYRAAAYVSDNFPDGVGDAVKFECSVKAETWRVNALMGRDVAERCGFDSAGNRMQILGCVYAYFSDSRGNCCPSIVMPPARMWMLALVGLANVSTTDCEESGNNIGKGIWKRKEARSENIKPPLAVFCQAQWDIVKRDHPGSNIYTFEGMQRELDDRCCRALWKPIIPSL
jgi:hypothetical protein